MISEDYLPHPSVAKPKGLVGIIGNDAARFHLFTASVLMLDRDGIDAKVEMLIGGDWCGARNQLVERTLEGGYDWLWFMDDDHAFPPDLLKRLLAWDAPIVSPLCLARIAPFPLVTYETKVGENLYLPVNLDGSREEGLIELEAAGCAGMLIRREVLETVPPPWFEYTDRSEDIVFCEKAKHYGFQLWGDLGARLGHITTAVVFPDVNEGEWMTRIKIGGGLDLFVSPAHQWEQPGEAEQWAADEEHPPLLNDVRHAERIEIWMDDELRWWWRALDDDGRIIAKDSVAREEYAMAASQAAFVDAPVYFITSEIDDSRKPPDGNRTHGPSTRLWNRDVQ